MKVTAEKSEGRILNLLYEIEMENLCLPGSNVTLYSRDVHPK